MGQLLSTAKIADIIASLTASEGINQKQTGVIIAPTFAEIPIPIGFYAGTLASGKVSAAASNIKSIQRGSGTMTYANYTDLATISAVDVTKSIVIVEYTSSASWNNYYGQHHIQAKLQDATTVALSRGNVNSSPSYTWTVIEFNNVKSLQKGDTILSATSGNQTISTIASSKSMLFCSFLNSNTGGGIMWKPKFTLSDSNIAFDPGFAPYGPITYHWQVIEFL